MPEKISILSNKNYGFEILILKSTLYLLLYLNVEIFVLSGEKNYIFNIGLYYMNI